MLQPSAWLGFPSVQSMLCLQLSVWFLLFSLCYARSRLLGDSTFLRSLRYARRRPLGRFSLLPSLYCACSGPLDRSVRAVLAVVRLVFLFLYASVCPVLCPQLSACFLCLQPSA